jgi:hypothetical protein
MKHDEVGASKGTFEIDREAHAGPADVLHAHPFHFAVHRRIDASVENDHGFGARVHETLRPTPHGSRHPAVSYDGARVVTDDPHQAGEGLALRVR